MTEGQIVLAFPVVLALHNLDECLSVCPGDWLAKAGNPCEVRAAMVGLTLAAAGVDGMSFVSCRPVWIVVARAAILGLLLNAFGHGLLAMKRRRFVPGTMSAVLLVVPYTIFAVAAMRKEPGVSLKALLGYAGLGAIGMPAAIGLFLALGVAWCRAWKRLA